MKNFKFRSFALSALFIVVLLFSACSSEKIIESDESTEPKEITNDFSFPDFDILTPSVQDQIEQLKFHRGYRIIDSGENPKLLFIGLGLKPTGGYDISVTGVDRIENTLIIRASEKEPNPDDMVTQALTNPYVLLELSEDFDQIKVTNQNGEEFSLINFEDADSLIISGEYVGQIDNNSIEIETTEGFMVFRSYQMSEMVSNLNTGDLVQITYTETEDGQLQLLKIEALE